MERAPQNEVILQLAGGQDIRFALQGADLRYERTTWHPEFGRNESNLCLVADMSNGRVSARISWEASS
jgi:hypothetical protein